VSEQSTRWSPDATGSTIDGMAVQVDASLPVHPLTVDDLDAMVRCGILAEDDRVELLDGVLVEMSPQSEAHAYAIRELLARAARVVLESGLRLSVQSPLNVGSPISRPEPDLAVVPAGGWDAHAARAVLVVEVSVTSRAIDLGRKAAIYAAAGIPDYWVLDIDARRLIVHRDPADDRYATVDALTDDGVVTTARLPLTIAVAELLPPAPTDR
jgi:Uma2 family endonuclease